MTKDNSDQTNDLGLDDDMLRFCEDLDLSEQMFSNLVTDHVTPAKEFDFPWKDSISPKDTGTDSHFSESEVSGKAVTLPDDDPGTNALHKPLQRMKQPLIGPCSRFEFSI